MDYENAFKKLIQAHDGDMALVYMYVRTGGAADAVSCAKALYMTSGRAADALEKLRLQGLIEQSGKSAGESAAEEKKTVPYPADESRSYTAREIEEAFSRPDYKALQQEAEKVLGRELSRDDLEKLLDICSHLEIPVETVFVLLHYCEKISNSKLRMSFIQRQAYNWKNRDVITVEQAEDYVEKDLELRSVSGQIRQILQIRDRNLTPPEQAFVNSWIADGFTLDAVESAYETTVMNTGKLSIQYLDKVLRNDSRKSDPGRDSARKPKPITSVRKDS